MSNFIYALIDLDGSPFYVGKTVSYERRLRRHVNDAKSGAVYYVHNKIRKLLSEGWVPDIAILESGVDDSSVDDREMFWIDELRKEGRKLCNLSDGGEGGKGFTAESNRKGAEKRRGRKRSEETKRKLSEAKKGVKFSQSHKEALSKAWKRSEEWSKNQSENGKKNKGKINIKIFKCISPDGSVHLTENGLTFFCEQHGLTASNMHAVLRGSRQNHKGWTIEKVD